MSADAKRFRDRAIDCRAVAKGTRSAIDAALLEEIAAELDEEAKKIDAEEAIERADPADRSR
jgi:hypothetical protein